MGLFRRRSQKRGAANPLERVAGLTVTPLPGRARCEVAGTASRQRELTAALHGASPNPPSGLEPWTEDVDSAGWIDVLLVPVDSVHDPTAVAVVSVEAGRLGWIPESLSGEFRQMLTDYPRHHGNDSEIGACPAYVTRIGERQKHLGLRVCCSWPDEVLADLDQLPTYARPGEP
jgi:hypothetical protein